MTAYHFAILVFLLSTLPFGQSVVGLARPVVSLFVLASAAVVFLTRGIRKDHARLLIGASLLTVAQFFIFHRVAAYPIFVAVLYVYLAECKISSRSFTLSSNACFLAYIAATLLVFFLAVPLDLWTTARPSMFSIPQRIFPNFSRLVGLTGSPADLDSWAGLVILMNLFALEIKRSTRLVVTCIAAMVLVSTGSLTPLLALACSLAITMLPRRMWPLVPIVVVALTLILAAAYHDLPSRVQGALYVLSTARIELWSDFLREFAKEPLVHRAFGNAVTLRAKYGEHLVANPHNFFLYIIIQYGAIGGLLFMWFMAAIFQRPLARWQTAVVAYIFICSLSDRYTLAEGNPVFIFTLAWLAAHPGLGQPEELGSKRWTLKSLFEISLSWKNLERRYSRVRSPERSPLSDR